MRHRSNYDWMLFLTSPMAVTGVQTHEFVFTKPNALISRLRLLLV